MAPSPAKHLRFSSRGQWRAWLEKNHAKATGAWLAIARKNAGGLHYDEAVEEAVSYGWIDSTVNRLDDTHYLQWYSPRKAGSDWSRSNKARVERLMAEGRMKPAGLAAVEHAGKDGSWEALDAVERLEVPRDLEQALGASKQARAAYEKLPPSHRKQYLYWINSAKRPATREKRIRETISRLVSGAAPGS